jgi:hypothetical protein
LMPYMAHESSLHLPNSSGSRDFDMESSRTGNWGVMEEIAGQVSRRINW